MGEVANPFASYPSPARPLAGIVLATSKARSSVARVRDGQNRAGHTWEPGAV